MNAPAQAASNEALRPQAVLILRGHYRLAEKPQSTLEALHVFFPRDANRILEELRTHTVIVRRGEARTIRALAMSLRGQGFDVEVRAGSA